VQQRRAAGAGALQLLLRCALQPLPPLRVALQVQRGTARLRTRATGSARGSRTHAQA
jgi:hypothetical protein